MSVSAPVEGGSVSTGISGVSAKAVGMQPKSSTNASTRESTCIKRCFMFIILSKSICILKSPDFLKSGQYAKVNYL